ncbi:hypothetical protein ACFYWX_11705 [Streptomyces sp. NPDC002888]|uniref:hypothetical protein n=1 Tax=Streptomyces sp. NPDC002888 TaxID=3364668 RepID=UPI0036B89AAE
MIKQVSHTVTGVGAADLGLALGVAYALHAPVSRAPEVAVVARTSAGRRATARSRRRTTARG